MHFFYRLALCACVLLTASTGSAQMDTPVSKMGYGRETEPVKEVEPLEIEDGRKVSLEFILSLDDGSTVDSNLAGGDPLVYEHGAQQLLPGLERELVGMKLDERKKVTISPENAHGLVNPELIREVDALRIPEQARKPGFELIYTDPQGFQRMERVIEVKDESIVLDGNHPLAGKALHYDIRVIDIE